MIATGRLGSEVIHWRQGPYAVSGRIELQLPAALLSSPLGASRTGTISVRIVSYDPFGEEIARSALPRLTWTLAGSRDGSPVLAPMDQQVWSLVADDPTLVSADL